jgi:hypothetical protein
LGCVIFCTLSFLDKPFAVIVTVGVVIGVVGVVVPVITGVVCV